MQLQPQQRGSTRPSAPSTTAAALPKGFFDDKETEKKAKGEQPKKPEDQKLVRVCMFCAYEYVTAHALHTSFPSNQTPLPPHLSQDWDEFQAEIALELEEQARRAAEEAENEAQERLEKEEVEHL